MPIGLGFASGFRISLRRLPLTLPVGVQRFQPLSTSVEEKVVEKVKKRKSKDPQRLKLEKLLRTNLTAGQLQAIATKTIPVAKASRIQGHLISKSVASEVVSVIKKDFPDLDACIVEINPGFGHITSHLEQAGYKYLNGFEEWIELVPLLKDNHPKLNIVKSRFLRIAELDSCDRRALTNKCFTLLSGLKRDPDNRNLIVVGVTPNKNIVSFALRSIVKKSALHNSELNWQPVYYLLVHPSTYAILTASPSVGKFVYRVISGLFQTFTKHELIGTFPLDCVIPGKKQSPREASRIAREAGADIQDDLVYLVKFQANTDLLQRLSEEEVLNLDYFIRSTLLKRKLGLIQKLESWIPDCGPRLIRQGYTIFTKFGELTPAQVVDIYNQFRSWPEFDSSAFRHSRDMLEAASSIDDDEVMEDLDREDGEHM